MRYQQRQKYLKYGIWWFLFLAVLVVLVGVGWVLNILDITQMNDILTGLGVVRIAGIFIPPLGAIMGYFF